jgi:uncharacterized YccA/Bax inhibitor family protein
MAIYKSGNPALNKNTFKEVTATAENEEAMTLEGTARKSLVLLALCVASGAFGWQMIFRNPEASGGIILVSAIAAFVVALITIFKKTASPITAPLYALLEGYVVGAISALYNAAFSGIVLQAILLTLGIFAAMLFVYLFRIIRVTENFKLGVAAATGGIALYYLGDIILSIFGHGLPLIASNSFWGIAFTALVIVVAAFNLVVDFDFIEQGVDKRAPKFMEWYASFGLFVTLVWLYLEILRLLAKGRSR